MHNQFEKYMKSALPPCFAELWPDGGVYIWELDCLCRILSLRQSDFSWLSGDILLQKHLGNAATYETAARLIYLLENHLWGFAKRSQYLSLVAADKILLKKAYDLLVSEVMEDEKLLLFWDRIFTRVGICWNKFTLQHNCLRCDCFPGRFSFLRNLQTFHLRWKPFSVWIFMRQEMFSGETA